MALSPKGVLSHTSRREEDAREDLICFSKNANKPSSITLLLLKQCFVFVCVCVCVTDNPYFYNSPCIQSIVVNTGILL